MVDDKTVMELLSQDDDDTVGRVGEVCDNGTSVENGELVDEDAEASERIFK